LPFSYCGFYASICLYYGNINIFYSYLFLRFKFHCSQQILTFQQTDICSAPLSESKYSLVRVFISGSKLTHSQHSFSIQPTEWMRLLGSCSATVLSCFAPVSHYQIFPFALAASYSFWQYVLFLCNIASKDFDIARSFNCYRAYLGFLSISDMTSTTNMVYFTTKITLTQYAPFTPSSFLLRY